MFDEQGLGGQHQLPAIRCGFHPWARVQGRAIPGFPEGFSLLYKAFQKSSGVARLKSLALTAVGPEQGADPFRRPSDDVKGAGMPAFHDGIIQMKKDLGQRVL